MGPQAPIPGGRVDLKQEYGVELVSQLTSGSLNDAIAESTRRKRLLLLYLHAPSYSLTADFVLDTLASPAVRQFLVSNGVFWGIDVESSVEGYAITQQLGVTAMPALCVLYGRKVLLELHGSSTTPELFDREIALCLERVEPLLIAERFDEDERLMREAERLRKEEELAEALRVEQQKENEKERKAAEERERKEAERRAEEERRQAERRAAEEQEQRRQKVQERKALAMSMLVAEPDDSVDGSKQWVCHVRLTTLEKGKQLQRRFHADDNKVSDLRNWAIVDGGLPEEGLSSDDAVLAAERFTLISGFPPAPLQEDQTLREAGLFPRAVVVMNL